MQLNDSKESFKEFSASGEFLRGESKSFPGGIKNIFKEFSDSKEFFRESKTFEGEIKDSFKEFYFIGDKFKLCLENVTKRPP